MCGAVPLSGEQAHACAHIHMLSWVPFDTCRGIFNVSFWELGTGESSHPRPPFRISQTALPQLQIYLFFFPAASKSGLLLFSLNSGKKKKNPLKMVFLSTAVRQYKQSLALTSSGLVYLISRLLLSLKTDARDSGCSAQQFSQDVPSI